MLVSFMKVTKSYPQSFRSVAYNYRPGCSFGGRKKALYRFVNRRKCDLPKPSIYNCKTDEAEIRKVSFEKCCIMECCKNFTWANTLAVRQQFYLKSYADGREHAIASGSQLHAITGVRRLKFVTPLGSDVCLIAWYLIHGIPKSTFHTYLGKYNEGLLFGIHGNKGYKRPRLATMQVVGSIAVIVAENADQMPHQMRGTVKGRMDMLKFLSCGNNWRWIQEDANEECFLSIGVILHK
jgi:hypothetical protein